MTELRLARAGVSDRDAEEVAAALRGAPATLTRLDVSDNALRAAGFAALAAAVAAHGPLPPYPPQTHFLTDTNAFPRRQVHTV